MVSTVVLCIIVRKESCNWSSPVLQRWLQRKYLLLTSLDAVVVLFDQSLSKIFTKKVPKTTSVGSNVTKIGSQVTKIGPGGTVMTEVG